MDQIELVGTASVFDLRCPACGSREAILIDDMQILSARRRAKIVVKCINCGHCWREKV